MTRNLTQVAGSLIGTMEEFYTSEKKPLVSQIIHITDSQTAKILDTIPLGEFWDDNHHKSLKDTLEYFEFRTFGDKRYSQYLEKMNRLIIPDEDGTYIEFVIFHAIKYRLQNAVVVDVYAPASYLLLKKAKVIKPQRVSEYTASQHLGFALNGTEWRPGIVESDKYRTLDIENHTNPYAYIKRIANEFELEPRFRVETDGNKVIGRYVDLIERVGEWQGREVEFGRDLLGIERKVDDSNVVTALIGLGPEREDGTRLEVMVEDEEALQRWGIPNPQTGELMHLIETYEPESTDQDMTIERLTELTRNELEKRINSVVEYTADVADLEKVPGMENKVIRFGDTIKIKDVGFNPPLYLEARVHTQDRSLSQPEKKKVTLGDYIEYTEEEVHAIWKQLQAEIAKKVSMAEVTEVVYTKTEVDQKDNAVKDYAEGVAENKKQEAIQISAEDATNKANQAENRAKDHADTIAEQKKQEAINAAIADAEAKVNQAKTELEADIALKADAEWVNGQLVLKENAITKSNTAPANPTTGQLWLDTSVTPNVLKRWSGSAWVKATPTSAGEVGAYTKTEVDNALNSKVSVTQYTTDMNGIVTRLNSAESRITQTENEIATKVSDTTYQQDKTAINNNISDLQTRMSNAETSITQNANQIALKANKTDVYTKTEIDGQFNTVNQQISQLDAELSIQADQIATKVSRTEFESLQIGGRNYARELGGDNYNINRVYSDDRQYTTVVTVDGKKWLKQSGTTPFRIASIPIEPNTTYTWSFNIYKTGNEQQILVYQWDSGGYGHKYYTVGNSPVRIKHTFTSRSHSTREILHLSNLGTSDEWYFSDFKLEKGNRATDWTPAPEDVQGQIDGLGSRMTTAETSITQLSDQIILKANQSEVDALSGRVNQAESQITQLAGQIELRATKTEVDELTGRVSTVESTIQQHADMIESKIDDGQARSIFRQEASSFTFEASQINFKGHVFGEDATFKGRLEGATIIGSSFYARDPDDEEEYPNSIKIDHSTFLRTFNNKANKTVTETSISDSFSIILHDYSGFYGPGTHLAGAVDLAPIALRLYYRSFGETVYGINRITFEPYTPRDGFTFAMDKATFTGSVEIGSFSTPLWTGALYPLSTHTIIPSKKITDCMTGWILRWQAFNRNDGTVVNSDFHYVHIPKIHVINNNGAGVRFVLARGGVGTIGKYVYVYDDRIVGYDANNQDANHNLVLTGVFEY